MKQIASSQFKLAVEHAADHIIITDPEGKILYANPAALKLTGFNWEEMEGNTPALWGKQMPPEFYKLMWHTIKDRKIPFSAIITNRNKQGFLYKAEVKIAPVLDEDRELMFFVGIEREVSDEEKLEQSKNEFITTLSHQLRTPLTGVSWTIDLLLKDEDLKLSKDQQSLLIESQVQTKRATELVSTLLLVVGIEANHLKLEVETVNLSNLCLKVIEDTKKDFEDKDINLEWNVPPQITLEGDKEKLEVVLRQMIGNAFIYTPENGSIAISLSSQSEEASLQIKNTGNPIPLQERERIFDKFYRGSNANLVNTRGTGVGLFISNHLIEMHGGNIAYIAGENSNHFVINLPVGNFKPSPQS